MQSTVVTCTAWAPPLPTSRTERETRTRRRPTSSSRDGAPSLSRRHGTESDLRRPADETANEPQRRVQRHSASRSLRMAAARGAGADGARRGFYSYRPCAVQFHLTCLKRWDFSFPKVFCRNVHAL